MSVFTTYQVKSGDTLFAIARKFGMGVDELKAVNSLKTNNLSVGQNLKVRSTGGSTPIPVIPVPPPPPVTPVTPTNTSGLVNYQVRPGDTLYAIATRFGMSVDALKSANGLTSNNLSVGQILQVKSSGGSTPAPPPPTPTPVQPVQPIQPIGEGYLEARRQFTVEMRPDAGFNRYAMRVPLLNGGQVVANLRDNVTISPYMVYPQGVMYGGQSAMALDIATIQSVGLTLNQAKALQYVSTHEGKFDAINSYDKAIFSYGFIQFTGASAVGGSLNRVMASMKQYAPAAFQRVFQRVGIDSEGSDSLATTTVLTETGAKLRGDDAWLYIQRNISLCGAFIQAGFESSLIREQLRMANILYVQAALNFKLDVTVGGIRINIPKLSDIIKSEAALTAVIALAVNQGVGGMSRLVGNSVSVVAGQSGLTTPQSVSLVDEWKVIKHMNDTAVDERVRARTAGVLQSGLSFMKV